MRSVLASLAALAFALAVLPGAAGQETQSGFRALSGSEANSFAVPSDMRLVASIDLGPSGVTYERYQQYFGAAQVLGAQVTVYRDESGAVAAVIGSHYPNLAPSNAVSLSTAAAGLIVEREVGPAAERVVDLMLDPATGEHFFLVESRSFASRWFHWVDAASGRILNEYNAIETGEGIGVKGDTKNLAGLTTFHDGPGSGGPHYDLLSTDNRQVTFDARNHTSIAFDITDDDDVWDTVTSDRQSPGHPALVDAHYYANTSDDYLQSVHGLDWIADCGYAAMQSVAHFDVDFDNAFWNGTFTVYGDGDGVNRREYSAGLDVVAHEHAHGVTDCTSNLIYQDESGALNESFSDIVGNSTEFFANEPDSSNCVKAPGQTVCADWWVAEDVDFRLDAKPGFRNMADPEEDADPDHYSEYIVTSDDSGGVHSNSGIPNQAYYLLANGGLNASCAAPSTHSSAHCSDGDTQDNNLNVTGIGVTDAEQIFFLGVTALPSNAAMCDARAATEAAAGALFGSGSQQAQSTKDAWVAVGLTDTVCVQSIDSDGDGVSDAVDNCPGMPNGSQADLDGDNVGDTCDNCPATANGDQTDTDSDGLGDACDPEDDGDGLTDVAESGTPLCGNDVNEDGFDDAVADDGCPGGPPQAGSFSEAQFNIGTNSLSSCQAGRPLGNTPSTDWPLDLHGGDLILDSRNRIDVADLGAFLAPLRRLDTSPGDANYDQRYDLIPGPDPIIAGTWIDVSDFGAMLAGAEAFPPMFGIGVRALDGPACTP